MTGEGPRLRVLFVCTGNTCRSPFMELVTRHRVGEALAVSSAGTHATPGAPVSEHLAPELRRRGLEPEGFGSRALTGALVDAADLVVTAGAAHRAHVLEERPDASRRVFTLGQLAALARSVDTHRLHGRDLVASYGVRSGPVDPDLDVADPFGRGPVAATACAEEIDDLLEVVLPALTGTRKSAHE